MLKTCDVIRLINDYGDKATLSDILKIVADGRIYKCPKCNGLGYTVVENEPKYRLEGYFPVSKEDN